MSSERSTATNATGDYEEEDPVEAMLKKTGCIDLHYKVQECIAETKDWRKCQNQVNDFRICMSKHQGAKVVNRVDS